MNPIERNYSVFYRYVHSWPGQSQHKRTCKHQRARRDRFKARHSG